MVNKDISVSISNIYVLQLHQYMDTDQTSCRCLNKIGDKPHNHFQVILYFLAKLQMFVDRRDVTGGASQQISTDTVRSMGVYQQINWHNKW